MKSGRIFVVFAIIAILLAGGVYYYQVRSSASANGPYGSIIWQLGISTAYRIKCLPVAVVKTITSPVKGCQTILGAYTYPQPITVCFDGSNLNPPLNKSYGAGYYPPGLSNAVSINNITWVFSQASFTSILPLKGNCDEGSQGTGGSGGSSGSGNYTR